MSREPELYKPAEACRIAEVAPYVLRYWETEFPSLSDGKEKGAARLYTGRDVKVIRRIRELLYDEGFTVAGAKKRLEAEISEGRFDDDLQPAPPPAAQNVQKKTVPSSTPTASAPLAAIPVAESGQATFISDAPSPARKTPSAPSSTRPTGSASSASSVAAEFPDRKRVVRELKEIVKLLDRSGRKTR